MPIEEVLARHRTARLFTHEVDGLQFMALVPTAGEMRRWVGELPFVEAEHQVMLKSLQGWNGVTERHLDPQASTETAPFSTKAADVLLSERPDLLDALFRELVARFDARQKAMETARGNL